MGKQVPLVVYKGGTRTVIGMASVQEDGSIEAQVMKDHWPTVKDLFLPNIGELSIAPVGTSMPRKRVIIENTPSTVVTETHTIVQSSPEPKI